MFADPAEIDAVAARIAAHARATRHRAQRLGSAAAAVRWTGTAARSFEACSDDVIGALLRSASGLDSAADALARHAANVRRMLADLDRLGHDLAGMGGDLHDVLRDEVRNPIAVPGDIGHLARHGGSLVGGGLHAAGDLVGS